MIKRLSLTLVSAALLAAGALSAPAVADDKPAAAADAVTDSRVTAPPAGKGQIVFYRPSAMGMLLSFTVLEGDKGVTKLSNNSYSIVPIDPGAHTYTIEGEAKDTLTLEVEAGETYYVKQTMGMGIVMGRPHLNLSDAPSFGKAHSLSLSTMKFGDKKSAAASTDAPK
jgi:hypothetical protein